MNLETILNEWEKDCRIQDDLAEASRSTPSLHAKYLQMLSISKLRLKKLESEQKVLLKEKWLWYNGKMCEEELKEKGWEPDPFNGLKVMKGDMDHYYDSDPEIQQSEEKIQYWKTIIDTLKEIVDTLRWRHQTVSNIIKWKMFERGD